MKYFIKEEFISGVKYWMIYVRKFWFFESFYERWNTPESAKLRVHELTDKHDYIPTQEFRMKGTGKYIGENEITKRQYRYKYKCSKCNSTQYSYKWYDESEKSDYEFFPH